MSRKPPVPQVQSYLLCREILQDRTSGEYILLGPIQGLTLPMFPAAARVSIFIRLTGGHGTYKVGLILRDAEDQEVGRAEGPEALHHDDPLRAYQICWQNFGLQFLRPGRHALTLTFNGEPTSSYTFDVLLQAR